MDKIIERYSDNSEENRLFCNNAQKVEYLTTIEYFGKIFHKGSKVLDCCAGTGAYSFWLSDNGFKVTAGDLVKSNIDIMIKNNEKHLPLDEIYQGNVLDMSKFDSHSFDVVLCMGALYHLENEKEREKAVLECLRVLKPNGILAFSYINAPALFAYNCKNKPNDMKRNIDIDHLQFNGMFYRYNFREIDEFADKFSIEKIVNIATTGLAYIIEDSINAMTEENFELWLENHLKTCEEKSILGYSMFGLYFAYKK